MKYKRRLQRIQRRFLFGWIHPTFFLLCSIDHIHDLLEFSSYIETKLSVVKLSKVTVKIMPKWLGSQFRLSNFRIHIYHKRFVLRWIHNL